MTLAWKVLAATALGSVLFGSAAAAQTPPQREGARGGGRVFGQPSRQPGPAGGPAMLYDATMGKLTVEIMALRQMLDAGFTAKDVETSLAVLREMAASERALKDASEAALQSEKAALLKAGPDTDIPHASGPALEEAARKHGEKVRALTERLREAIGERKAGCLLNMLGMMPGPIVPPFAPGMPGMGPGTPLDPRGGMQGPGPGRAPRQGQGSPGGPGRPNEPTLGAPSQGFGMPGIPQGPGTPGFIPQGPQGPGIGWGPQPGMGMPWAVAPPSIVQMMGPRLTIAELVDLLEQKLAAMK